MLFYAIDHHRCNVSPTKAKPIYIASWTFPCYKTTIFNSSFTIYHLPFTKHHTAIRSPILAHLIKMWTSKNYSNLIYTYHHAQCSVLNVHQYNNTDNLGVHAAVGGRAIFLSSSFYLWNRASQSAHSKFQMMITPDD